MPRPQESCPADPAEMAEAYCLGRLTAEAMAAFEDHYLTCPACAEAVEAADAFVRALKKAARRLTGGAASAGSQQ